MHHHPAFGILKTERQTAELSTFTAVGRASETVLRGIATSAIAHTERTMDECFQLYLRPCVVNSCDLLDREFSCEHHPTRPHRQQPAYLLFGAVICLRTGMNLHTQFLSYLHHRNILHDERINTCTLQRLEERWDIIELFLIDNGIDGGIDTHMILMSKATQLSDIVDAVAGRGTGTKAWGTDIHGIGTMEDGSLATSKVARWRKEFNAFHSILLISYGVS